MSRVLRNIEKPEDTGGEVWVNILGVYLCMCVGVTGYQCRWGFREQQGTFGKCWESMLRCKVIMVSIWGTG